MKFHILLLLSVVAGCGSVAPTKEPVDVSVSLSTGGKPIDGVKFNFQPTGEGLPAVLDVKDGQIQAKVIPGKYTWFVSAGDAASSLKGIPTKYCEGSLERQFEIAGGESLKLDLN